MSAIKHNLLIEKNATFSRVFVWRGGNKRPINTTGYDAKLQIRAVDGTILIELSVANTRIVLGGTFGTIKLIMSVADMAGFTWTAGVYDLILTAPDGTKLRLLEGKVSVSPGVTA